MAEKLPVTRSDLRNQLVVNAATKPLNVAVGAGVAVAGILIGVPWLIALAALVYGALAAITFFDGEEAERVGDRAYGKTRQLNRGTDLRSLAAPIAAQLEAARRCELEIAATIERSDLPFGEVGPEVEALSNAMESLAMRAQRIWSYLETQDQRRVQQRLEEIESSGGDAQTIEAMKSQLSALDKLTSQLQAFYSKMEGLVASMSAINAELVRLSVASEDADEASVADRVRSLREQVDAASAGLEAAFADR